jgi:hypothetical protein
MMSHIHVQVSAPAGVPKPLAAELPLVDQKQEGKLRRVTLKGEVWTLPVTTRPHRFMDDFKPQRWKSA